MCRAVTPDLTTNVKCTSVHRSHLYHWLCGVVVSGVRRMNEVNARWAQLVPGWVTIFGRVYHLGM